ncbi:hypothetical protein [uncultured Paludibaculum sp.]|uniref:hypothetical protein n=1 Tax=uncultured Paludibaculum sp. TaxID=1765020 RepID=UPI002AAB5751|nr:hypothetical protein [uncultured Paludibaculum sp.]
MKRLILPAWLLSASVLVLGQIAVRNQGYVPFSDAPIFYRTGAVRDPVALLQTRLDRGEAQLTYEEPNGYLKSVLKQLDVPVSSQSLVFSKTSFQFRRITPRTPRALYFNDDVYIGWVSGGKLEVVSFDPMQGAIFYILENTRTERPVFERAELDCTQCHVVAATRGVPGVLLRSVHTNPSGVQSSRGAAYVTGHDSPLGDRFGGWYVTGTNGRQLHMGNVTVQKGDAAKLLDRQAGANLLDLGDRIEQSLYLSPHSDIVAQLVQAHQTQMHNLITLANYRTRIALHAAAEQGNAAGALAGLLSEEARKQFEQPAEELVRYLLFANETRLEDPIKGTSNYTSEFTARGPRDEHGRSLRDFDLKTRLFRYPCSYLIYSEAFDDLPEPARSFVYRRLHEVLTGKDTSPEFAHLTREDRKNVLDILLATKKGLPEEWRQSSTQINTAGRIAHPDNAPLKRCAGPASRQ